MNTKRILVIRPDHLGDLILSLPVAEVLKGSFPNTHIAYLAAQGPSGVGELTDYVDQWIIDTDELRRSAGKLSAELSMHNFDLSIELKPAWRTALAAARARIPIRIGTSRRFYSFLYNTRVSVHRRGSGKHQTDLDLALLKPFGIDATGRQPNLSVTDCHKISARKLVGETIGRYIVLHAGSSGSAPNWPESNYWILAGLIQQKTDYKIVLTGQEIFRSPIDCINLGGRTGTVSELAGVISEASVFISGSTGPLHLADALGINCLSFMIRHPDIGIERWGPRRNIDNVMLPEMYCHHKNLKLCNCLETISPEMVFDKLSSILKGKQ
jgi:heptosyltransferase III